MQEEKPGSGVSAIILAAGMSRRMGTPKQLLRMGERTLLEHALENVRRSGADEIILVLGFAAEIIRQQVSVAGVKVVINPAYQEGMGTSLRAGLAAVGDRARAALIVLADQPFVRPATLDRLIEHHARPYPQTPPQIVIPVYKGFRGNPVLLDRSVFPELMNLAGDTGCRAIFGNHLENILKVPVNDAGILLDVDNQEDLEKLRQSSHPQPSHPQPSHRGREAADLESRELQDGPAPSPARPELVVVGREALAMALATLGRMVGFTVTLVDPLLSLNDLPQADRVLHVLDFSRLPGAPGASGTNDRGTNGRYIVVASQGRCDEEAVEQALLVNANYVALVAGKSRTQEIVRSLKMNGASPEKLARLRAPAGLDIGAESPEEIALSVMAEIVAQRRRPA